MSETEISIKVKVFSDHEYCQDKHDCCVMLDDLWCPLFQSGLKTTDKNNMYSQRIKCDACKEALKQANK